MFVEEDVNVKEKFSMAINKEAPTGIKKEEIPEDKIFPDIKAESNEVSYKKNVRVRPARTHSDSSSDTDPLALIVSETAGQDHDRLDVERNQVVDSLTDKNSSGSNLSLCHSKQKISACTRCGY